MKNSKFRNCVAIVKLRKTADKCEMQKANSCLLVHMLDKYLQMCYITGVFRVNTNKFLKGVGHNDENDERKKQALSGSCVRFLLTHCLLHTFRKAAAFRFFYCKINPRQRQGAPVFDTSQRKRHNYTEHDQERKKSEKGKKEIKANSL